MLRITQTRAQSIDYIRDRIHDPTIAALLIGKAYRAAELDIRFSLDPASVLYGNGQFMPVTAMITVLGNLIENAFDAMRGAPTDVPSEVTVSIREGARGLLLSVDDTGPGMTEEVKQRLFERGFSTKGEGRGTGLALVQEIDRGISWNHPCRIGAWRGHVLYYYADRTILTDRRETIVSYRYCRR